MLDNATLFSIHTLAARRHRGSTEACAWNRGAQSMVAPNPQDEAAALMPDLTWLDARTSQLMHGVQAKELRQRTERLTASGRDPRPSYLSPSQHIHRALTAGPELGPQHALLLQITRGMLRRDVSRAQPRTHTMRGLTVRDQCGTSDSAAANQDRWLRPFGCQAAVTPRRPARVIPINTVYCPHPRACRG